MTQLDFNAQNVAPATGTPDPVPAGWYNVVMVGSERKPTKAGDGAYLECTFKVIDGPYAERQLWERLNLWNGNPVAVEIAYGELSAIAHAVGVLQVQDSQQLHGLPLKAKVKYKAADPEGGYDASNEIGAYRNINEPVEVVSQLANPATGAPAAAAPPSMPAMPAAAPTPAAPAAPAPGAQPGGQPWAQPPGSPAAAPPAATQQPGLPPATVPPATVAPPQPAAQPAAQPTPAAAAPAAPASPEVQAAQTAPPPWQQPPAEGGAAAPAATPPWQSQ